MKISGSHFLCLGLLLLSWTSSTYGQEEPPKGPPPRSGSGGLQTPPPPIPKVPDVRQPGEYGWWVEINGGLPLQTSYQNKGHAADFTAESFVHLQGNPKYSQGAEVGIALGLHNALRFIYFETKSAGDVIPPGNLHEWDKDYTGGVQLSTNYRVQTAKVSFDYLTWPYPVGSRRFRLKTLWQFQYTSARTEFGSPTLPIVDSNGFPIVDSSGNPIDYGATGSKWFMTPSLGLGVAYFSGRHVRFEANAAGFAIPHHWTTWDTDATLNLRYGHMELRLGGKAFHWKTSTQGDFYSRGTLYGPFLGIRWHSTQ